MKAIILARVSTKEQEDGHSINAQVQRLQDYCQRRKLDVIKTYQLIESSTRGLRRMCMMQNNRSSSNASTKSTSILGHTTMRMTATG